MAGIALSRGKRKALAALCTGLTVAVLCLQLLTPTFETDPVARLAVEKTQCAFRAIHDWRLEKGIAIDENLDPKLTGLIGCEYSDITSTAGDLKAKQLSVNPAYAALISVWLKKGGVTTGDNVAVSFSGSFPALNIATLCALDAAGVKATVFSSVGASIYGANIPGLSWLDMERHLLDKGIIQNKTRFASYGGIADTEGGIDGTGFSIAQEAIRAHGATFINEGTPKSVARDVARRMELYLRKGKPKIFINVGGNVTSLGWVAEAALLKNGPLRASQIPKLKSKARGTIFRMAEIGVPVIHLLNIKRLNDRYHVTQYGETEDIDVAFLASRKKHLLLLGVVLLTWLTAVLWLLRKPRTSPPYPHQE